jgi:ParB family chromosome partitioning protein
MATSTKSRGLGRGLGELFQRTELDQLPPPRPDPIEDQPPTDARRPVEPAAAVPIPEGSYYAELPI